MLSIAKTSWSGWTGLWGIINKYNSEEIYNFITEFYSQKNDANRSRFMNEINDLMHVGKVSKNEFSKTIVNLNMDINIKTLMIMLMRDSNSLLFISAEAIKSLKELLLKEEKNFARPNIQVSSMSKPAQPTKYDEFTSMQKEAKENLALIDPKIMNNFFLKLAEFLYNKDLTLYEVIHIKIFDKMYNGKEYELIYSNSFFRLFEERGLTITEEE